jgi:hypothetical protein
LCDRLLVFVSNIAKRPDRHPDVPEYENRQSENNQKLPKGHARYLGRIYQNHNRTHGNRDRFRLRATIG